MPVGGDVNVCSANEFNHLLRTDEAIVEDHVRFHSDFFRQALQVSAILVAFATQNMRVGRARDDVNHILVFGQDLRQGLNHVFDSLVW